MIYDVLIIGGGVIGCSIAYELSKYDVSIVVLEKGSDVAEGISKANSGVLHAGFNLKTGSLKAKMNIQGLKEFPALCKELDVSYKNCKKLVVAKNDEELKYLEKLLAQGIKNGCFGLSIINQDKIRDLEPFVHGKYALFSEATSIINPQELNIALAEVAVNNGVDIKLNNNVVKITNAKDAVEVETKNGDKYFAKIVVNAAGLFSDVVASMTGSERNESKIYPYRGEYLILDKEAGKFLNMAIYPVPHSDGRGLGIHLTITTNGEILVGPSSEYIEDRHDLANTKQIMDKLKKEACEFIPELENIPIIKNYSGLRPKLFIAGEKSDFEDFIVEGSKSCSGLINLIGIESPGLTSCNAIAKYVVDNFIQDKIKLNYKDSFNSKRKKTHKTRLLDIGQLEEAIKEDPNYGEVVCRCNQISKKEILDAINNPLKATSLNAVKKRAYALMGRCQGGFCLPKITNMMLDELGFKAKDIVKNNEESNVLFEDK